MQEPTCKHDQLWNLIPVLPEANSAKSNRLPADEYLDCFVKLQNDGLNISKQVLSYRKWARLTKPFVSDLHVSYENLVKEEIVKKSYGDMLPAIVSLAKQIGFKSDWRKPHILFNYTYEKSNLAFVVEYEDRYFITKISCDLVNDLPHIRELLTDTIKFHENRGFLISKSEPTNIENTLLGLDTEFSVFEQTPRGKHG